MEKFDPRLGSFPFAIDVLMQRRFTLEHDLLSTAPKHRGQVQSWIDQLTRAIERLQGSKRT